MKASPLPQESKRSSDWELFGKLLSLYEKLLERYTVAIEMPKEETLATAYVPARRAAGADPLVALRHE